MRIAHPGFLLLYAAVAALAVLYIYARQRRRARLAAFVSAAVVGRLVDPHVRVRQVYKGILLLGALACMVAALAGPQVGMRLTEIRRRGVDIIIAVDCSKSMRAEDYFPNRLGKAKNTLAAFINRLEGHRVGIVAFAGTAFVQCPLTLDYSAAKMFLRLLDTDLIPRGGTAIGQAITVAMKAFHQKERDYKVLILLTDGEDHGNAALKAAREARREGIIIHAIGIGKPAGEVIPVRDPDGNLISYQKDSAGNVITTRLDETTLQKIALETAGTYYRATAGEIEIDRVLDLVNEMNTKELSSRMLNQYENRYQFFLLVAILLLVLEFFMPEHGSLLQAIRRDP